MIIYTLRDPDPTQNQPRHQTHQTPPNPQEPQSEPAPSESAQAVPLLAPTSPPAATPIMTSSPRFMATTDLGTSPPQPVPLIPSHGSSTLPIYPQTPAQPTAPHTPQPNATCRCCSATPGPRNALLRHLRADPLHQTAPPPSLRQPPMPAQQSPLMSLPTYRRRSPRGSLPRTLL